MSEGKPLGGCWVVPNDRAPGPLAAALGLTGADFARESESERREREDAPTIAAPHDWPRPIPVTERLPEEGQDVLAFIPSIGWRQQRVVGCEGLLWMHNGGRHAMQDNVAHWLPLPPCPEPAAHE